MAQIVRVILFPPGTDRISQMISSYVLDDHGVLHYRDLEGVEYQTSIPYVIEHLEEGRQKTPFSS